MTLIDFALIPLKKEEAQPKEEGDFLSFQDPFRSEQTQCSRMFFFEAEIYTYIRGNEKRNSSFYQRGLGLAVPSEPIA